ATGTISARRQGSILLGDFPGPAVVRGTLDVTSSGATFGGSIDIGPNCTLTVSGTLDSRGGGLGTNTLTAGQMTLESSARLFADSKNDLTTRDGVVTIQQGAVIQPPANPTTDATTPYCCNNGQLDPGEDSEDGNQPCSAASVPNHSRFQVPYPCAAHP